MDVCGSAPFGYATRPHTSKMRFFYNFQIEFRLLGLTRIINFDIILLTDR